ncbi:hypothetical protein [Corynebacterium guaraldiae]|uniref:hypothetical protein n=1 Tax=Corynebacterium guaraldiae TaxID=3051103 RepID=UPI0012B754BF|nr:hypothetical protein [Corynebacterium guaraldiae]MTD97482.1 hypothetical protein [Corynebacterium guaraldiae]
MFETRAYSNRYGPTLKLVEVSVMEIVAYILGPHSVFVAAATPFTDPNFLPVGRYNARAGNSK